jgi:hypothetical protein
VGEALSLEGCGIFVLACSAKLTLPPPVGGRTGRLQLARSRCRAWRVGLVLPEGQVSQRRGERGGGMLSVKIRCSLVRSGGDA